MYPSIKVAPMRGEVVVRIPVRALGISLVYASSRLKASAPERVGLFRPLSVVVRDVATSEEVRLNKFAQRGVINPEAARRQAGHSATDTKARVGVLRSDPITRVEEVEWIDDPNNRLPGFLGAWSPSVLSLIHI